MNSNSVVLSPWLSRTWWVSWESAMSGIWRSFIFDSQRLFTDLPSERPFTCGPRHLRFHGLRARATASRLLSPDTGNLNITRTCTMKIHYFILQIARRRRRNYVFSFKRSMGEPLKIEEKCVLAAGICGQLGGPAGICGPRTTPLHTGGPSKICSARHIMFQLPYGQE